MTNIIQVPQHFDPRDYQLEVLNAFDNGCRKILLRWARQMGKDTLCWAIVCKEACKRPGNYFYIFPEATQAREALWDKVMSEEAEGYKLLDMIPKYFLNPKEGGSLNNQSMQIKLINGSKITVLGLDTKPDKIRGVTPTGIVFSEFAFSENMYEGYKIARPSFRREGMWQIINSTPNGRNHYYDLYHGATQIDSWSVSYKQALWPEKDNFVLLYGFKDFEEQYQWFEDQVKTGEATWDEIEREYGCSFEAGLMGSIYSDMLEFAREESRIGFFKYDRNYPVYTGWDIGVDDDTCLFFFQLIDSSMRFIKFKEWKEPVGVSTYIQYLAEQGYTYDTHCLPHDADNRRHGVDQPQSTRDLLEEVAANYQHMTGSFITVPKPQKKQEAINLVRTQFPSYYFDTDGCHEGLEHVERYHRKYDKSKKVFTQEPVHDKHSHAADALQTCALARDMIDNTFFRMNNLEDQGLIRFNVFDD